MGGKGKKNREKRRRDEEEEEVEMGEKYRRLSMFVDDRAVEASDDEDEDYDGDEDDGGFIVGEGEEEEIPDDYEDGEIGRRSPAVRRATYQDDNDIDVEAMEEIVKKRYSGVPTEINEDEDDKTPAVVEQQSFLPSVYDPKLWMVKCLPGHEKKVAASLMQKSVDKDSEMRILSAIALDHLTSYIYVEAFKEADVKEACKGMRSIFSKNITMVPLKEMSNVLSVESAPVVNVSIGDWVRLTRSQYKGSLAKVVDIDHRARKVTVKVAPKMSALSLDDKLEGIHSFYKTVALSSVTTGDLQPSIEEIENFRKIGERNEELATLFNNKEQECFERGDRVTVLKGELKNLPCSVEYVEADLVHIKPNVDIPLKTITMRKTELVKHFEPGCQVKVVNGLHEGTTGMVIKVDGNKLIILSDASKDQITVLSRQAVKSVEISESTSVNVASINQVKPVSSNQISTRVISRPPPGPKSFSTGRFAKRQDSMVGKLVKIIHGPYRGYRGCVKSVKGQNIRIELQAQMKVVTVDRSHISDHVPMSNTNWNMQQGMTGSETPLYSRTPMHSMGGETPWRTPRHSTPVHHSSVVPACGNWSPFSLTSPARLTPTP